MRGHNSAAYGEELREDVETILSDDSKLFHFAKWNIGDYVAGTVGMKLELEGAYIRFLMRLYQRGKPLPDDDRFMSTCMSLTLRVWKRVKQALVAAGKIVIKAGALTNARFEKERAARAEQLRKMAEAARKRHEDAREKRGVNEKVSPKFAQSLPEVSSKLSRNTDEKINNFNETELKTHPYARDSLETRERDKIHPASDSVPVAAGGMHDPIDGLNGATVLMQMRIAKWMNPYAPKHQEARQWLTSTVALFGSDVVRDAFASVEAKEANGEIVGSPIKLMTAICQQKAAQPKPTGPGGKLERRPEGMPEAVWRQIQENQRAGKAYQ